MTTVVWCSECERVVPVLTERQVQVLRGIAKGRTSAQIAREVGLTYKTVKNYTSILYEVIGVRNRVEATLYAISNGIVKPRKAHAHTAA